MGFNHATFTEARTALSRLLKDEAMVHWSRAELSLYLKESLSFYALLTDASRARKTFPTVAGQAIYDLGTIPELDEMLARTTTDTSVLTLIKYHLMEPQTSIDGMSGQFSYASCVEALQRALNRFLSESEMRVSEQTLATSSPPIARVTLSDSVLSIVRLATLNADGDYLALVKETEQRANAYASDWDLEPGVSEAYSIVMTPQLEVQLIPPSNDVTQLHLLTLDAGATLDPLNQVALDVQNDYCQFVKWLALYIILIQDGEGRSEARAQYCKQRAIEGEKLARMSPSVLQVAINGRNCEIETISDFDARDPEWQSTEGVPTRVAMISSNLLALSPVPDGVYSITLDLIGNAILPSTDDDYVQVSRDAYDAILQYAVHLASFKEGANKLLETKVAFESLMEMAAYENARLRSQREDFDSLRGLASKERMQNPTSSEETVAA